MSQPKLVIEFEFRENTVSSMAERDVKEAVKELGETLEYLGKVVKAEIRPVTPIEERKAGR